MASYVNGQAFLVVSFARFPVIVCASSSDSVSAQCHEVRGQRLYFSSRLKSILRFGCSWVDARLGEACSAER